jgi:ADP-heptose:LPS heptosyltransferase
VRADVAASGWADARVHLLMGLCGARIRAGFPMTAENFYASHLPWRRKQIRIGALMYGAGSFLGMRPLLTRKVRRADYYQHHVEDFRDLAGALGIAWDETRPWLPAPATPSSGPPVWLVHPGARFAGRRWPLESFGRIIREVLAPAGAKVLFVRAPELAGAVPQLPGGVEVVSPGSLREFMDLCATAEVLLCNDTGVSHMGAALGKRVVTIFSDQEPRWFAPRGSERHAVWRDVCPHRPCMDHCVMPSYICLEAVTYEMVREQVLSILEEARAGRGSV